MLDGVDVSWVQGNYRPGGEQFVIANASRANGGLVVGSAYRAQVANARAAGKHVGHYFFNGNIDPVRCADFFVDNLDYVPGDSLWLDVESEPSTNTAAWSPGQALAFLLRVKARLGVVPGVYLNKSIMNGFDWSAVVATGAPLWIAYYNPAPPPIQWWPTWTVWQYTSVPMDLNRAQGALVASAAPIAEEDDVPNIYEIVAGRTDPTGTHYLSVNRIQRYPLSKQSEADYQYFMKNTLKYTDAQCAVQVVNTLESFGPIVKDASATLDAASVQAVVAAIKGAGVAVDALTDADVQRIADAVNNEAAQRLAA